MSFESWWIHRTIRISPDNRRNARHIWEAARAEAEAEMRKPGPCGKRGHLMANLDMRNDEGVCAWCEELEILLSTTASWQKGQI